MRETIEKWFADGTTWVGIFENKDLGHRDLGRRVGFAFDTSDWDSAKLGDRAPDHRLIGLGWRYLLIGKATTVDEALTYFTEEKEEKVYD